MTTEQEVTCIVCPLGCRILVKTDGTTADVVEGNKCKKGVEYAQSEALDPRRMLTSSIYIEDGNWPLVSVKSTQPVPKGKVFAVLAEIKKTTVKAPVTSGQVLLKNVAGTGINIVATKTVQ